MKPTLTENETHMLAAYLVTKSALESNIFSKIDFSNYFHYRYKKKTRIEVKSTKHLSSDPVSWS